MKNVTLPFPELIAIAGTRALGGIGIGLLVCELLPQDERRMIGAALVGVGVLSTVPLIYDVLGRRSVARAMPQRFPLREPVQV